MRNFKSLKKVGAGILCFITMAVSVIPVGAVNETVIQKGGSKTAVVESSATAPTSVTLNKTSIKLGVGETFTLTPKLSPSTAKTSYTWSTTSPSIATISSAGKITAKKVGTATITVKTNNGKKATCVVTVKSAPTSITASPATVSINVGKTYTVSESTNSGSYSYGITWTSSDTSIATVAKQSGGKAIITAKKKGTATITVKTYNGKKSTCKVTVKDQTAEFVDQVISKTNAERTKAGLPKLSKNTKLCQAAQERAKETVTKFSHTRPNGKDCFSILKEYNITYSAAGENIAYGYVTPDDVVKGWMGSPGHKANILNKRYKSIGVGFYEKNGAKYWVQMFIG